MRVQRSSRECFGWTWEEYTRGKGQTGGAPMEYGKQSDEETRLKRERRGGRRASDTAAKENEMRRGKVEGRGHVKERGAGGGSGTTNQVDCLITSCIPHSSPILPNTPPPSPHQLPHPRSLAPSASPWQPDRVPNT